ncbi:MAG: peroxide stress protein YaaA [Gammaproteobacteria bacterium]|nr:peroxide stress protein YaaA [Gammaproteobacteria bacterium]
MLAVVSPAKTLDYDSEVQTSEFTRPRHLKQSQLLINRLRDFSALDLTELQHVSSKIAELNFERNHQWKTPFNLKNARQALFAFKGDVYTGLDAYTMNEENIQFAQDHLLILSGLYGVLRPLDLMQPYRLEMGTKLETSAGKNLYEFWDMQITDAINKQLKYSKSDTLINLASNEYFKSVKTKNINGQIITPAFKDYKNGQYKMIGFFAKKARGLMARYLIDHQLTDPNSLKDFNTEGYQFNTKLSDEKNWVFTRRLNS